MGKGRKRKHGLSDRVSRTRQMQKSERTTNPFELKVNRQKHNVFGRKANKQDKGRPGLSHSKAIQKRKATLLKEYKQSVKSNKFIDKRIGENDTEMSLEDKMMQRFALEKKRSHSSASRYNLDTDELTHYGQSLSEIEKFDDPLVSDDDDDDVGHGQLSGSVSEELFGGFMEKKDEDSHGKKSWKERMQELINNSKKEKYERQSESEKIRDLTQEVDKQWKYISLIMAESRRDHDKDPDQEWVADAYDIAVNTMKFDRTATPSDRTKTEEEIAKDEFEKLQDLEAGRVLRMSSQSDNQRQARLSSEFRSADDLDDGYRCPRSDRGKKRVRFNEDVDSHDDEDNEEADSNNDDDDEDSDSDSSAEEQEDSGEDIESDEEVDNEKITPVKKGTDTKARSVLKKTKPLADAKASKTAESSTLPDLPYTFEAPVTYQELDSLLDGRSSRDKLEIITRLRKCHHISLASENKEKLENLFSFLLQYFCDSSTADIPDYETIDGLTPHLYTLCQLSPEHASKAFLSHLLEHHREFRDLAARKGGRGIYPNLDALMLLRLVALLFSTCDFSHPVVNPSLLYMCQILAQTPVTCVKDVAVGLFICYLCLEYTCTSKRFLPEVLNHLHGCLFLAAQKPDNHVDSVKHPFRPTGKNRDILLISSDHSQTEIRNHLKISETLADNIDRSDLDADSWRLSLIYTCLRHTARAARLYSDLPSYGEVFQPIATILQRLPRSSYPQIIQSEMQTLSDVLEERSRRPRKYLSISKPKPKALKMYECEIEDKFDGRKKHKGKPEQKQQQKLKYLHRKELKGAIREVKRDSQFIARIQLDQQKSGDEQRKRKVKEIYSMLSMQEGEYNKLKREKTRGK